MGKTEFIALFYALPDASLQVEGLSSKPLTWHTAW